MAQNDNLFFLPPVVKATILSKEEIEILVQSVQQKFYQYIIH